MNKKDMYNEQYKIFKCFNLLKGLFFISNDTLTRYERFYDLENCGYS